MNWVWKSLASELSAGIATIASNAGLGRESLYKTLKPGAQPRFETVRRLLDAMGVKLGVLPPQPPT